MKARYGVLAIAGVAALTACGGKASEEAKADSATPAAAAASGPSATLGAADVATAVRTTLNAGVALSGSLEPKVQVTVSAPLAEQIVEMMVSEGDAVREGQPIARFKDDVLRAGAASGRADVANARMGTTVSVADSTRAETLFREGAIARRDRDNAVLATEAARARLALAEAQAASAIDRLETATLKAPVTGVVSARHAQAGDRVDFGKPVVDIVDTRVLQLSASVEAQWLRQIQVGRRVSLMVSQGDTVAGRVARINPTADPATRQVRIYVDVPNPGNRLVGGLFVSGRVLVSEAANVVAVPAAAVRREGADTSAVVYVVANGKVARRAVTVGVEDAAAGLVQIRSGIVAGDVVVIGPVDNLADGMRVEVAGQAVR